MAEKLLEKVKAKTFEFFSEEAVRLAILPSCRSNTILILISLSVSTIFFLILHVGGLFFLIFFEIFSNNVTFLPHPSNYSPQDDGFDGGFNEEDFEHTHIPKYFGKRVFFFINNTPNFRPSGL